MLCLVPPIPIWNSTNSMIDANPARNAAAPHVGSAERRSWRASRRLVLRSDSVGLRPVRPRVSIEPAALPRCFVRRLRLVWAMGPQNLAVEQRFDRGRHAQFDLLRPAAERGLG